MRNRKQKPTKPTESLSIKNKVQKKVAKSLAVPENSFAFMPQIEISGNKEAIVGGCKGIIEYDENQIKLNLGSFFIKFIGTNLMINSMNDETGIVSGLFSSIEFST